MSTVSMSWAPGATLSNPYFSLMLEPRHGGRIVSLATQTGELTTAPTAEELMHSRVQEPFGLLSVQLWQDSYWHNDLCHREWPVTNTNAQPDRFEITLTGDSVLWPGVTVDRTVVITADPWLDIHHRLDPGATTGPYSPPAFWFSSVMSGRGRTFVPGPTGVLDYPRWPQHESWCHEPTDGWVGWIGASGGLAVISDARRLRHVRLRHLRTDRLEWIRRRVPTVEQARVRLVPFSCLKRVDGAGDAGIVAVEQTPGGLAVDVYALLTGDATLRLELIQPNGTATFAATESANLVAGSVSRFEVSLPGWPTNAAGLWWRGKVRMVPPGAGASTFLIAAIGSPYLRGMLPPAPQVTELPRGDRPYRLPPRSFLFDATPVPLPRPWLKRPGVKPRVLALVSPANTATLLALADQFDIELILPYIPRTADVPTSSGGISGKAFYYELGDRYEGVFGDELIAVWTEALSAARTYDVILLGLYNGNVSGGHDSWALLPQNLQAEILARVHAGTGLVVIRRGGAGGPNPETATLQGLLPISDVRGGSDYDGPCHPMNDRTVRGLPWSVFPSPGPIFGYSASSPTATVLIEIEPPAGVRIPLLARTTYGAGRVLDLVWGPFVAPPDQRRQRPAGAEETESLRYDLALLARLIQDASGRSPAIAVRNVALVGDTATVDLEQVDTSIHVFDLNWIARDRFGTELGSGQRSAGAFPASGSVGFSIPSGAWTLDVVVQPSSGEPGWGAGGRILDIATTLTPNESVIGRDDAFEVFPSGGAAAAQYEVQLVDGRQRIMSRQIIASGERATIRADRIETPRAELRVHGLDASGRLVGQHARALRARGRTGMGAFPVHYWNDAFIALPGPLFVRHLDANGALGISAFFTISASSPVGIDVVAAADRLAIPYVPQSSGWLYTSGGQAPDGSGSQLSLTNAQAVASGTAIDRNTAAAWADANVLYYMAGDDEPNPPRTDVSFDPSALTRFRAWLSDAYGHLDSALQAEWGAGVTLVAAMPRSHADAVAAFNAGGVSYAPWVDHRRFMMDLFSRAPATARQALRRGDPRALAGTSGDGLMSMVNSRDWWTRGRALDIVVRKTKGTALILKALGALSMPWTGYDDPDPIIRHQVWSLFGLGEDGMAIFQEMSLINPDLSLPETARDLAAALLPVRRGVGGLFSQSKPADDGVFVLASPDSSIVLAIHGYESLGGWASGEPPNQPDLGVDARENAHELLNSMGVSWNVLSPAEVESGALELKGARALILPMCAALSDAACEAIRRWVAKGGHVVADLLPGVFNAHGRLRGTGIAATSATTASTNPLDQVFGLTPGARPPIANTSVTIGGAGPFKARVVDTGVAVTPAAVSGGTAAGGAPLWFGHAYGRGTASYLGCSLFADYNLSALTIDERIRMDEAFLALLLGLGLQPRVSAVDTAGNRIPLCQYYSRSLGATELIVLLRDYHQGIYAPVAAEVDGELRFRASAHTYDIDSGTYLGFGDRLRLRVSAYTFRAFARLPYRVESIDVQLSGCMQLGGAIGVRAKVVTAEGPPGCHRLRLDVLAGHRPLRYLAREAMADCGVASFTIPVAFNDPSGTWTIVVTDIATGVRGEVDVMLAPRALPRPAPPPFQVDVIDD